MEILIIILKILLVIWVICSAINVLFSVLVTFEAQERFENNYIELYNFFKEHKEKSNPSGITVFVRLVQNVIIIFCPVLHLITIYVLVFNFEESVNTLTSKTVKTVKMAYNKYKYENKIN